MLINAESNDLQMVDETRGDEAWSTEVGWRAEKPELPALQADKKWVGFFFFFVIK